MATFDCGKVMTSLFRIFNELTPLCLWSCTSAQLMTTRQPTVMLKIFIERVCLCRCAPGYTGDPTIPGQTCSRNNGM